MITKPSKVRKLSNYPKRAMPFFDGYKFENKYFSTDYRSAVKNLHDSFPLSQGQDIFAFKMQVYSTSFSRDYFSRDVIRVHESILRIGRINLNMLPIGFHIYFDETERSVKSTFYFLNFNKLTDESGIKSDVPSDLFTTIKNKVTERTLSHYSFSRQKSKAQLGQAVAVTGSDTSGSDNEATEVNAALFEFVSLFGDLEYKQAFTRALRGLPLNKAQKLAHSMNELIKLNGDESISNFRTPAKKTKQPTAQPTPVNKRESENFLEQLGLTDTF
ncbi:hypothetical protein OTK49_00455 [Vibrio coralliirubri]|uniref:hypothetical protein n=1 Tax=Vibrio coralliirubri TaxID=1516159 RepID=UPI0022847274|nr:hypothetical protein [Vibrio coralliirubri]MCY9861012.1 hypothetical protein [Vibrio coralliirubri]